MYMGTAIVRRGPIYYKTLELQRAQELERIKRQRSLFEAEVAARRQEAALKAERERLDLFRRNEEVLVLQKVRRQFDHPRPTRDQILDAVAMESSIPVSRLQGKEQKDFIIRARKLFCYLCIRVYGYSMPETGRALGKDHTTARHHALWVDRRLSEEPAYSASLHRIRVLLSAAVPHDPYFWGS